MELPRFPLVCLQEDNPVSSGIASNFGRSWPDQPEPAGGGRNHPRRLANLTHLRPMQPVRFTACYLCGYPHLRSEHPDRDG